MKTKFFAFFLIIEIIFTSDIYTQGALIINHTCTDIRTITETEINLAKSTLHIAYGHTSHGSQVTDGLADLVAFANGGGKGLSLPNNIFQWNDGGTGGVLDLHDYAMGGDAGYYPDWVDNTRSYLGEPDPETGRGTGEHADINVIIWSWCGQVSGKYASGTLYSEYINPMAQLELDYPNVKFVYMTGHLDHWDDENNKAANNEIRQYCTENNKVLFDFADIESYNPDGVFFEFADDACNYYSSADDGSADGNWAEEWRNAHVENIDWYNCGSAHSDPLNANQKAYAAWRLWVELAKRFLTSDVTENKQPEVFVLEQNYPNPFNPVTTISYQVPVGTCLGMFVQLKVYDLLGKEVATIVNEEKAPGYYQVKFSAGSCGDRSGLSSGVYIYRLTVTSPDTGERFVKSAKMTLTK